MKKILIFCSLTLLIGCGEQLPGDTVNVNPEEIDRIQIKTTQRNINIDVIDFTYKNHEYLYFIRRYSKVATSTCVHNPDCKYCKNK